MGVAIGSGISPIFSQIGSIVSPHPGSDLELADGVDLFLLANGLDTLLLAL